MHPDTKAFCKAIFNPAILHVAIAAVFLWILFAKMGAATWKYPVYPIAFGFVTIPLAAWAALMYRNELSLRIKAKSPSRR